MMWKVELRKHSSSISHIFHLVYEKTKLTNSLTDGRREAMFRLRSNCTFRYALLIGYESLISPQKCSSCTELFLRNCKRCDNEYCVVDNDGSSITRVSFCHIHAFNAHGSSAIGATILDAEHMIFIDEPTDLMIAM
jgi:hypothetical protein